MSKGHKHPDRKGRRVSVHVDHLADVVIQRVAEREGLNYSMALCAMVLNAALPDKELQELLKKELAEVVVEKLDRMGWYPDLSKDIARELVTGEPAPAPAWN